MRKPLKTSSDEDEARVYVDQFPESGWGKWNGGGHMLSNNLFVLHNLAKLIGLRRSWFQQDGRFYHYDVTCSKRLLAIKNGAISIEFGEIPPDVVVKDRNGQIGRYSDRRNSNATS